MWVHSLIGELRSHTPWSSWACATATEPPHNERSCMTGWRPHVPQLRRNAAETNIYFLNGTFFMEFLSNLPLCHNIHMHVEMYILTWTCMHLPHTWTFINAFTWTHITNTCALCSPYIHRYISQIIYTYKQMYLRTHNLTHTPKHKHIHLGQWRDGENRTTEGACEVEAGIGKGSWDRLWRKDFAACCEITERALNLELDDPEIKPQLCRSPAVWHQATALTSLCFSFPICKMGLCIDRTKFQNIVGA